MGRTLSRWWKMPGDFLTTAEAAALLGLSPARVRELAKLGVFVKGQHFGQPRGMHRRWFKAALEAHLRGEIDALPVRPKVRPLRSKLNRSLMPPAA